MFGFPVEINLSFLLLLAVVFIAFGGLAGVFITCIAFASVLLHELGHALVARKLGVHVAGIELSFFGGAAKMADMPKRADHEIAIAAAGPAVSLMLGGLGLGLGMALHAPLLATIGWINFVLAAFNHPGAADGRRPHPARGAQPQDGLCPGDGHCGQGLAGRRGRLRDRGSGVRLVPAAVARSAAVGDGEP